MQYTVIKGVFRNSRKMNGARQAGSNNNKTYCTLYETQQETEDIRSTSDLLVVNKSIFREKVYVAAVVSYQPFVCTCTFIF